MSRSNIRVNRDIQPPKKADSSMRVINLSGYEVPTVKEHTRKEWVEYGDDNNYSMGSCEC